MSWRDSCYISPLFRQLAAHFKWGVRAPSGGGGAAKHLNTRDSITMLREELDMYTPLPYPPQYPLWKKHGASGPQLRIQGSITVVAVGLSKLDAYRDSDYLTVVIQPWLYNRVDDCITILIITS